MAHRVIHKKSISSRVNRILVVENCDGVREFVSHVLTSADFRCHAVSSGVEALSLLRSGERFDLMICDLRNKPHGIILLGRTKEEFSDLPVVIMTAPCCACVAHFAVSEMGATAALFKPFNGMQLLTTVCCALEGTSLSCFQSAGAA